MATWSSLAGDTGLVLAGPGAPLVSQFAIAGFALAIGRSTDSGRVFIATAVELKYRLPRTWARVLRGAPDQRPPVTTSTASPTPRAARVVHVFVQRGPYVSATSPPEDPCDLDLHHPRARVVLWTSPYGYQFLRDEHGTLDVSRDRPARGTHWPDPPEPPAPSGPQHFY